jgi:hypothetical protein
MIAMRDNTTGEVYAGDEFGATAALAAWFFPDGPTDDTSVDDALRALDRALTSHGWDAEAAAYLNITKLDDGSWDGVVTDLGVKMGGIPDEHDGLPVVGIRWANGTSECIGHATDVFYRAAISVTGDMAELIYNTDEAHCALCAEMKAEHVEYPHQAGTLYNCPACETQCHCTELVGMTCIHCGVG